MFHYLNFYEIHWGGWSSPYPVWYNIVNWLGCSHCTIPILFHRCRDSNSTAESYLPCSLALFHAYLQSFQKDYSATIKVCMMIEHWTCPIQHRYSMPWTLILGCLLSLRSLVLWSWQLQFHQSSSSSSVFWGGVASCLIITRTRKPISLSALWGRRLDCI